ncbi:hypothetical protein ACPVPU_06695 [Sphingomonas sp. CJ99]
MMLRAGGRPLRFAGLILGGWVVLRVMLLWYQTGDLPGAIRDGVPGGAIVERLVRGSDAIAAPPAALAIPPAAVPVAPTMPLPTLIATAATPAPMPFLHLPPAERQGVDPERVNMAMLALIALEPATPVAWTPDPRLSPDLPAPASVPAGLSGSAWLMARGGAARPVAGQGQLGGSQAGARLRHPIGHRAIAAMAGVNVPIGAAGRELVAGLEWRPLDAPVTLIAEQRMAVDGVGAATGAAAVAGIGPQPVGGGLSIEAYGQAGAVMRDRLEPYADGAARALHPVGTTVAMGGGIWGGIQRDAARLDIGPSAVATVRLGNQPVRVALDWRQRVAGDAAPDSGPALTIGLDF